MNVLGISGSISADSRTRAAVEMALEAAGETAGVETRVLHLGEYDLDVADGRELAEYRGETAEALDLVLEGDAYVIGTPVYRAAYSGALKNLLDMIPRGQWQADVAPLADAAVGLVATGASNHHYLSVDEELRPVLAFFGAHVVGGSVYATADQFEDGSVVDKEIGERLRRVGRATVDLGRAIEESGSLSGLGPQI